MEDLYQGVQLTDAGLERRRPSAPIVERLTHLESADFDSVDAEPNSAERAPVVTQSGDELGGGDLAELRLQQQLDLSRLKLYAAVDQVRGVEAERAAALARVAEVEHHLHLRDVEVASLSAELETVRQEASSLRLLAARRARETMLWGLGLRGPGLSGHGEKTTDG